MCVTSRKATERMKSVVPISVEKNDADKKWGILLSNVLANGDNLTPFSYALR